MGARSGNNYLSSLKKLGAEIWIGGARAGDVTAHPAFANCARSVASLYDMQMEHPETMTFRTDDGGRAGMSFIIPKSADDLRKRSRMMKTWADFGCGMLGRTPDYLNVSLAAMAAARDFFAESDPRFGDNIWNYYIEARHHDWCATHTLVNPRASRAAGWAGHTDADLALKLVEKTDDGIVVNGCRMLATLAPLSEELLVFPSTVLKAEPAAEPFALSFAIHCNAKGLKFLCRDTYDLGPLALRQSARLALRRDGRGRRLRQRARPVGARVPVRRRRAMQRAVRGNRRGRPHDASGGREERREERIRARPGGANRRGERRDEPAARPRAPRRNDHDHRDDARVPARRRSRRRARQMGRLHAGARAARHRAQSFPAAVSAHGRDHPAQQLELV